MAVTAIRPEIGSSGSDGWMAGFFKKSGFRKASGHPAVISGRPDFGPNRGKRGPISATSGPRRRMPRFGRPKRGTVRRFAPKIGAAADVLICPDFFKKSGFLKKSGHPAITSGRPDFGPNRGNRGPISATSGPRRRMPRFGRPKRGTVRRFAPKIGAAADVLICPDFFKKSGFLKKSGHPAITSGRPDFGPNRGNRGPISAASGPRRQKPRFGRPNRGTARRFAPKIGAAAGVLICPDFLRNPDF